MNEVDISLIESSLQVALPFEYKEFLFRNSEEVRRIKTLLPLRAVLWTDSDEIVRENELARSTAAQMKIGKLHWPENYLVIGTNGGGDYWFIDLTGAKPGLWFWSHEQEGIRCDYQTFAGYLAELRRDGEDPEAWVEQFR